MITFQTKEDENPPTSAPRFRGWQGELQARHEVAHDDTHDSARLLLTPVLQHSSPRTGSTWHPFPHRAGLCIHAMCDAGP